MKAGQRLEIRQRQSLAMTQGLRQAIALLSYNNLDLRRYLEHQAAENPFLEFGAPEPLPPRASARGFAPVAAAIWDSGSGVEVQQDWLESLPDHAAGLLQHVLGIIDIAIRDPSDHAIAVQLAAALEPSGWLGRPLEDIARDTRQPVARVEQVLAEVQRHCEPAGLFARSLSECLRIQAKDQGVYDTAMAIVLDNLDMLAERRLDALQTLAGTDGAGLARLLARLRSFDPKPGARFSEGGPEPAPADLIVRLEDGAWVVELNRSSLPSVRLAKGVVGSDHEAAAARRAAQALARSVARRNQTVLAVGAAVVQHQAEFLDRGFEALRPLTLREVAARVGMAESTVSRVVSSTMVATPRGGLGLREFFAGAVDAAGLVSDAVLRLQIARLIAAEDSAAPLDDASLAARLTDDGLPVSRRTVAKYRKDLRLPIASRRRR